MITLIIIILMADATITLTHGNVPTVANMILMAVHGVVRWTNHAVHLWAMESVRMGGGEVRTAVEQGVVVILTTILVILMDTIFLKRVQGMFAVMIMIMMAINGMSLQTMLFSI